MKKAILTILLLGSLVSTYAGHIAGGEIYYAYLGPGNSPNTARYQITLRLFKDCNATGNNIADLPTLVQIGI